MKSIVAILLVVAVSASQTSAQNNEQGRYLWTAAETEFGRNKKNLRARNRDLRVLLESPMSLSMSMPEADLHQLEVDFELSMSMSMP